MSPFRLLKPTDPYCTAWVKMRRRSLLRWLAMAAVPPLALVAVACQKTLFPESSVPWVILPLAYAYLEIQYSLSCWPCPRCGKPFYHDSWLYRPLTSTCLHCGLPEYAPDGQR